MSTYVDTSVLVALYVPERHSAAARREVSRLRQLPFTNLHALELRTALELLVGRGHLAPAERDAVTAQIDDDRRAGRLAHAALDWDRVFAGAMSLSQQHSARTLARSLDVLHVAAALSLGSDSFLTGDRRHASLATAAGLAAIDITAARQARPAP